MRVESKNFFFLSAWSIFLFYVLIFNESELGYIMDNNIIKPLVFGIVFFLSIMKIFTCDKYKVTELFIIIILTIFIACVSYFSHNYNLILFEFLVIASKGIDFKKIVKLDMIIKIACILILFILCKKGVINNYTAIINGSIKQSFGWLHPNTFGAIASIVILEYIYLSWNKLNALRTLFVIALISLVYFLSSSRTNVYLITFTVIFSYLMKHFKIIRESKAVNKICIYIYPIVALASFIFVYLFKVDTNLGIVLNEILTGRLYLANLFLENYGLSLVGQPLNIVTTRQALLTGKTPVVLDMAYIRMVIQYGIFYFLFFLILNTKIQKKLFTEKKYSELMIMSYFAIIGLTENTVLNLYMNISLFLIMQEKEKSEKIEKQ